MLQSGRAMGSRHREGQAHAGKGNDGATRGGDRVENRVGWKEEKKIRHIKKRKSKKMTCGS